MSVTLDAQKGDTSQRSVSLFVVLMFCVLYAEVIYRVVKANVLNNLAYRFNVFGHFALFHHIAKVVAKNTAEVVMSRIR